MSRSTSQVMVRMTPDMKDALRADSEANERTISQTVRLAIRQFFAAMDAPARPTPRQEGEE